MLNQKSLTKVMTQGETMFCQQCEQTAHRTGCTGRGVCGKTAETSDLQDILVEVAAGVSGYARRLPEEDLEAGRHVVQALFDTVTNVDFAFAEWRLAVQSPFCKTSVSTWTF